MTALPETSPAPPEDGPSRQAGPLRRVLRRLAVVLAATLGIVLVAGLAVRSYFSDERLRQLAREHLEAASGAPARLEALEVSLFTGVELRGLGLGPLPGFTRDTLAASRAALHWRWWELLRLRVVITEIALEDATITVEDTAVGRNTDVLLARLLPTPRASVGAAPAGEPATPGAVSEPVGLGELSLPVAVAVERFAVRNAALELVQPGVLARVDHLNAEGRFAGAGKALELDLWLGLGERAAAGAPSEVRFARAEPRAEVSSRVRAGAHLRTAGLGEAALDLTLDSRTEVTAPVVLPAVEAAGRVEATADLVRGRAELRRLAWRLGRGTELEAAAVLEDLTGDTAVEVLGARARVDLDELGPLVAAASPGTRAAGHLELAVSPFTTTLAALGRREAPQARLALTAARVSARHGDAAIHGLDATLSAETAGDVLAVRADVGLARAGSGAGEARDVRVGIEGRAPISPFAGGPSDGEVTGSLRFAAGEARTQAGRARGIDLALELEAEPALLLGAPAARPLAAALRAAIAGAATPEAEVAGITVAVQAKTWDLAAERLEADATLAVRGVSLLQSGIRLPPASATLGAARSGDTFELRGARLELGRLATLVASGAVSEVATARPAVRGLTASLAVPALDAVLALLPESLRPPGRASGRLDLSVEADGTIPYADLAAAAIPPAPSLAPGRQSWGEVVRAHEAFIEGWASRLAAGLPFAAALRLRLRDAGFSDEATELSGLAVAGDLELRPSGPRVKLAVELAQVVRPAPARDARAELELVADGAALAVRADAALASLAQPPLVRPLAGATLSAAARYRLGGDFVLERFAVREADHGLRLDASGVVVKPLPFVRERGWELAGVPGLEARLRFGFGYGVAGDPAPVAVPGPALGGIIGVDGTLDFAAGLAQLRGALTARDFSYADGPLVVEEMSGGLPFDVQLYAGRRDDATPVVRGAAVGGGTLSLVAASEDVRSRADRPAYYDRLQSYRHARELSIRTLRQEPYEIRDFRLSGRITSGMFIADAVSMSVLGGDVVGNLALQLARDASVRGELDVRASGIDASNFELLALEPGPDSELNADFRLAFLFAPRLRDLAVDANVTKIGAQTFDRFLQLLDPERKDEDIQDARSNLKWIRIDSVAMWMRYENLNMDLNYATRLRIPFTPIAIRPIQRDLLRRFSVSGDLDAKLQPVIDLYLAPALGWSK